MNLARIKFFGMFICALCKVQRFVSKNCQPPLKHKQNQVHHFAASSDLWLNMRLTPI